MAAPAVGASGPWRMGGLGFGLPLSRLYARYFGTALPLVYICMLVLEGTACTCSKSSASFLPHNEPFACGLLSRIFTLDEMREHLRVQAMKAQFAPWVAHK